MPKDRREIRRTLLDVAGGQSGLFTAAQALSAGYSYQAQKYHVDHGNWARIDRALFRLPEWPVGPHEDLMRWVLWSRGKGVISHETALSVNGLGDVDPTRVHLSVPPNFRMSAPGVELHRGALSQSDVAHHDGLSITTAARTVLDVAAGDLDADQFRQAVSEAIQRGMVTRKELLARADAFGTHAALRIERALVEPLT